MRVLSMPGEDPSGILSLKLCEFAGDHTRTLSWIEDSCTMIQPAWPDSFCQLMQVMGRLMFGIEPAGECLAEGVQTLVRGEVVDIETSLTGEVETTVRGKDSEEDPCLQILVKTLNEKITTLEVKTCSTVFDVKIKIQEKENIPPDQQRLMFAGKQMHDDLSLNDYHIREGDCLRLSMRLRGGMQKPGAHILAPILQTEEGFQNEDEAMPETHTPQVGTLILPSANVVSASDSTVTHLRMAWTHSANERLEMISQNIPQMQVEWHTMDPSREEPHVQMTPQAYDHYEQEIVGALVASGGETRQVALFDRESANPFPELWLCMKRQLGLFGITLNG